MISAAVILLNMLNKMPIDILKLDMKFIQNETESRPARYPAFYHGSCPLDGFERGGEGVETRNSLNSCGNRL